MTFRYLLRNGEIHIASFAHNKNSVVEVSWKDKRPIELRKAIVAETKKFIKESIIDFWLDKDTYNYHTTLITPHNIARIFEVFYASFHKNYTKRLYAADPKGIVLNENSDLDNLRVFFTKDQMTS